MAAQTRTVLKGYFNTGDTPTETQFANLIDSFHNTTDDGTALTEITSEAIGSLSDVVVTGTPADNEVLAYDSGGNWINQTPAEAGLAEASHTHVEADITDLGTYLTDITGESVGDLSDVTITTGAQGDILYNNGSAWVNLAPGTSGQYLQTQGAAANPQWATLSGGGDMAAATYDPATISEQLVGLTATQTLTNKTIDADNNTISNIALGAEATGAINDLSDVTITTPADNEVLAYNGTDTWINQTPAEAGLAEASHTHVEADITDLGTYLTDITGENLTDLADVTITTVADNEVMAYDSGTGHWINQTPAEANLQGVLSEGAFVDGDKTKLDGIEASADVTDATNVAAAGAVMESDVTAKGDIFVATASGTLTNLPVGTNDYVLTADSAEASGVKWAAAAAGGGGGTELFCTVGDDGTEDYSSIKDAYNAGERFIWIPRAYTDSATTGFNCFGAVIVSASRANTITFSSTIDVFTSLQDTLILNATFYLNGASFLDGTGNDSTMINCQVTTQNIANMFDINADTFSDCTFINCDFYLNSSTTRIFYINGTDAENILFDNCLFNTFSATAGSTVFYHRSSASNSPMVFDNCKININGSGHYMYFDNNGSATKDGWDYIFRGCVINTSSTSPDYLIYNNGKNVLLDGTTISTGAALTSLFYAAVRANMRLSSCNIEGTMSSFVYNEALGYIFDVENLMVEDANVEIINGGAPVSYEPFVRISNVKDQSGEAVGKLFDRDWVILKNDSGAAINRGDVVILKGGTTTANEHLLADTDTSGNSTLIYGIAMESIANGSTGGILTEGYCYKVNVDGTTDVAAGDFLGTFTSAGIAQKSTTAGARKIVALEAYTTDDSNGAVDAIVLPSAV